MTPQTRMRVLHVVAETPLSFLQHLKDITYIERRPLRYVDHWAYIVNIVMQLQHPDDTSPNRFCAERLQSLVRTLELNRLDEYSSLQKVANFATLVSTYEKGPERPFIISCDRPACKLTMGPAGFLLILEPFETDNATVPNPMFHFVYVSVSRLRVCTIYSNVPSVAWTPPLLSSQCSNASAALSSPLEQSHRLTCILKCCSLPR